MLYIKVDGIPKTEKTIMFCSECDNREITKINRLIQKETNKQDVIDDGFFFIENMSDESVTIGAIINSIDDIKIKLNKYLTALEISLMNIEYEEITFCEIERMMDDAEYINHLRRATIKNALDSMGISAIGRRGHAFYLHYNELILDDFEVTNIYKKAENLYIRNTLIPELDRIYTGKKHTNLIGHPVHYMIESDDKEIKESTPKLVLQALYDNCRIRNKRVTFVDLEANGRYRNNDAEMNELEALYKSCSGGSLVITFQCEENVEGSQASGVRATIENLSKIMNKYSNDVLTIYSFPKECTKIKGWFYEYLGNVSFVELKEEFIPAEEARKVLSKKAKDYHVRPDKQLMGQIKEDGNYLLRDLNTDFHEWFRVKLKRSIYPQYQCIESVTKKKVKESPKGTAYDDLEKMIGLDEVKKVIHQALDYYKAQKLFSDKGIQQDSPSMHMVFTGNPGTAKTTVARLFADIMKDNGVLSTGRLVEVGRQDLVGKYVGWTAPTVKAKFEDAKGGVLFIDEAYSLVDDRDGLYGDEAINTIVQEMENHRDEVIVIFAGYPDKMEAFLAKNPGLRSRIAFHVPFEDYCVDELCDIAVHLADKKGMHFTENALEKLKDNFAVAIEQSDFGNGRYVRNVIEKARMAQASRLLKMNLDDISRDDLLTFCAEDIEIPKIKKEVKIKMGFAC